jgi:hypothetical protein
VCSFAGYTRILEEVAPLRQLAVSVGYAPTPGRNLNASILFGFSDSAADIGLAVGWSLVL